MFRREEMEGESRHLPDRTLPKAGQLSQKIKPNTVLGQGDDPVVNTICPSDERDSEEPLLSPGHLPPRAAEGKPSIRRTGALSRGWPGWPSPCPLQVSLRRMR